MLVVVCAPISAQGTLGPKPAPGRAVTTWQTVVNNDPMFGRTINARNDTTIPIVITRVRLTRCVNLAIACDTFALNSDVIAPGGSIGVFTVHPYDANKNYSSVADVNWRPATECMGEHPPTVPDTEPDRRSLPQTRQLILPPIRSVPSVDKGAVVDVRFFIGASGLVDSTAISGLSDRNFLKQFKAVMAQYVFKPGRARGCPIPGTTSLQITMGR